MTISVIVPVYNAEEYLSRCVGSLLGQTYADWEIILVDDGSSDNSGAICDRYAQQDPRIRVVHKANGGPASARNAGMDVACGDYITFADSDDWLDTGAYTKLAAAAESGADILRFGFQRVCGGRVVGSFTHPISEGLYTGEQLKPMRLDVISKKGTLDYRTPKFLAVWGAMFRRAWIESLRLRFESQRDFFASDLNEDYLFAVRAMWRASSVYYISEPFYRYNTREGSLSNSRRPQMPDQKQMIYRRYQAVLPAGNPEIDFRLRNFYIDGMYASIVNEITCGQPSIKAVASIRKILRDEELSRCLALNAGGACTRKAKLICILMRRRMAAAMYWGYRLTAGKER